MTLLIFITSLCAGIAIGIPVAHSLVLCGVALMLYMNFFSAQIVSQNLILGIDDFLLLAIPFFILAGEIMNAGGLSRRIIDVAIAFSATSRAGSATWRSCRRSSWPRSPARPSPTAPRSPPSSCR